MMPGVVKVAGYTGCLFWLVILAGLLILLIGGDTGASTPEEAEYDRIAIPCGIVVSLIGLLLSGGILGAKAWAYYGFLVAVWLIAAVAMILALGTESWSTAAWAGAVGCFGFLVLGRLTQDHVRIYFGLEGGPRQLLAAPGWLNVGMGFGCCLVLFGSQPTPMFGVWMGQWVQVIVNAAFGAGHLLLGWGLLNKGSWVQTLTIVLGGASFDLLCGYGMGPES